MDAVVRGINKCRGSSQREWPDCLEDHRNLHGGDNIWMGSGGSDDKESACNAGDLGSIPELERSPGEGNEYPLQYSCVENSMIKWMGIGEFNSDEKKWSGHHGQQKSRKCSTWMQSQTTE